MAQVSLFLIFLHRTKIHRGQVGRNSAWPEDMVTEEETLTVDRAFYDSNRDETLMTGDFYKTYPILATHTQSGQRRDAKQCVPVNRNRRREKIYTCCAASAVCNYIFLLLLLNYTVRLVL